MSIPGLLALVVAILTFGVIFVATPLVWLVTVRLWRLSRTDPSLKVLRAHAVAALALSIIVTVFALLYLNNDFLVPPPVDFETTKLFARGAIFVGPTAAALYWLRFIWRSA